MGKAAADTGSADDRRTAIRRWATLRVRNSDQLTPDDNEWDIEHYSVNEVTWLAGMMRSYREYGYTPLQLIETEMMLPGLLSDLDKALWQLELISEALKPKDKKTK